MKIPQQPGAKRANHSTGPRSAEGKARSSMNALKSGIYSKSVIIPGEDPADLDTLTDEYFQRYRPAHPEQRDLVDILIRSTWNLRRFAAAEAQVWIFEMEQTLHVNSTAPLGHMFHDCGHTLDRLQRIVNSAQRNFRNALRELERLQALHPEPEPPPAPAISADIPVTQPIEPEPVDPPKQFVSSLSTPPPPSLQKVGPQSPEKPLPYHKPGIVCRFSPIDKNKYKLCPWCYSEEEALITPE